MTSAAPLAAAVSAYGAALRSKLSNPAIVGAPEDQVRGPLEALVAALAPLTGAAGPVALVGEASLSHLKSRPDYAVTRGGALVGFVEVKAPGKGADPRRFADPHDKRQWERLKALPNLLYTDGASFGLYRDGAPAGPVVALAGDIATAGAKLAAPPTLVPLLADFLSWDANATPPRTARALAEASARLCRLLRDEVTEELARGLPALTNLAARWRARLFPEAGDAEFADGYAQAVTFGLLVARARGISLKEGVGHAAEDLKDSDALIAEALRLLTENRAVAAALSTSLSVLTRVLESVDWGNVSKGAPDAWLYFYEDFLGVYDNALRKRTGSYYTPPDVVAAMTRLTDECLRDPALFDRPRGLASPDVTVADPAVGTGTFLLGVLRRVAAAVAADQGEGAVGPAVVGAAGRLVGFEVQFGPFAVAQLRLVAEVRALASVGEHAAPTNLPAPRLYLTSTLGTPFEDERLAVEDDPISESRRQANRVKRDEPITVVIGNPPYKVDAVGLGGWIERGSDANRELPAPLDQWVPPPEWGEGTNAKHLKNLYVYFWRWAALKVFGSGWREATGEDAGERAGVVCFITAAGFLNGPGFQKMRQELRRDCSAIWVIDCSPEGHQPPVASRVFQGVQQEICIVLAARAPGKDPAEPARVRFHALPEGHRREKFAALDALRLDDADWVEGATGWRDPFLPCHGADWADFAPLVDMFAWSSPGVKTHRTWVIAPDKESLGRRWSVLQAERDPVAKNTLLHADEARDINKVVRVALGAFRAKQATIAADTQPLAEPIRYGFRSFDRQWLPPDHRLITRARPKLWAIHSNKQVYITAIDDFSPESGPAFTITSLIPDQHHYHGRGGRVLPLWRDAAATGPNLKPALLARLAAAHGAPVGAEDLFAYLAAVMAHPGFTARFAADLARPGLRVPLTADAALFAEAAALGREVVWLHTYGTRFADPAAGRPARSPRLPDGEGPFVPAGGTIPGAPEPLPEAMTYDPAARRLTIGRGHVDGVPPEVWAYEVSGKNVLRSWFSYRRRDRSRPVIGDRRPPSPLDKVQPESWPPEYTSDLLDLLHVLGRLVRLEPAQAALLERVVAGPLLGAAALADALTGAPPARPAPRGAGGPGGLFDGPPGAG